jgi:hypothetical protein
LKKRNSELTIKNSVSLYILILLDRQIKAFKAESKAKDKKENNSKIEQYKEAIRDNDADDSLDIQKFLTDKKRKKKNVIELMRQQKTQKLKHNTTGGGKGKGPKRSGGHSRKMKKGR